MDLEVKKRILVKIGKLVDAPTNSKFLEKVAECISNLVETQRLKEEVKMLEGQLERFQMELFTLKEDMTTT